jgi:hypothetical protein
MGVVWPFIIDERLVQLTRICFHVIGHILGFLVETISWLKSIGVNLRYYLKRLFMAIFDKNGGCLIIDHRPEASTPHPTYVSLPLVTLLDFWWRPFVGKQICRC